VGNRPGQVRYDSGQPEVPLRGGIANRGLVFRVGETVRRPLRPTSSATHALLRHLAEVGFDGAPRSLGVDPQGREVLSYIRGDAVVPPYQSWALTDAAIVSVARLLRSYHDAVSSFDPTPHTWPEAPPPPPFRTGVVCHNDPNLDNVVFRDGEAVALIDFDLARPGSRLWDIAAATRLWAPLRRDVDIQDARRGRALGRFRLFVDAYGLVGMDRDRLVDAVISNHDWLYGIVSRGAEDGNPGFVEYWRGGAADRAGRTRRWYVRNAHLLRAALE
jgi:Phosphotransferase enzyme family